MAGEVRHGTLVEDIPTEVVISVESRRKVEVLNVDGAARIYFRADGVEAEVGAADNHVLPAAIGALQVTPPPDVDGTSVSMVSEGTPMWSVRHVVE